MSLIHTSMKWIRQKAIEKKWQHRSKAVIYVVFGQIWPNFELIQARLYILLPVRMRKIVSKAAEKKGKHHYPKLKSMGIFSDAQGQLTPQSVVGFGRFSYSFKVLCM